MLPRVQQSEVGVVPGENIFSAVDGHFCLRCLHTMGWRNPIIMQQTLGIQWKHNRGYQCKYISYISLEKMGTNVKNVISSATVSVFHEIKRDAKLLRRAGPYDHGITDSRIAILS